MMFKHSLKSIILIASLIGRFSDLALEAELEELESEGLNLVSENPFTQYALKRNGKAKKCFS
jgi:hypothetical protein